MLSNVNPNLPERGLSRIVVDKASVQTQNARAVPNPSPRWIPPTVLVILQARLGSSLKA